jgi:hypothetical protein
MAESPKQEMESPEQKRFKDISGLVYGGAILIGVGIGFATGSIIAGALIGVGAALLIVAVLRYQLRD